MTRRTLFLLLALAAVGAAVAYFFAPAFDDAKVFRPVDYMEYQTAGRATLNRENPYDGAVLYRYQLDIQAKLPPAPVAGLCEAGPGSQTPATESGVTRYADPIMMWNPPWTLPLTLPLGAMHWRVGQLLWTAAQLLSVVVSSVLLWRLFSGSKGKTTVAVGVAVVFAPTLFLLLLGQISGFLLLGLVGFLWFVVSREATPSARVADSLRESVPMSLSERATHPTLWLAGLLVALTAIKPHLLLPFALVFALHTLCGGRTWRTVIAGVLTLVLFGLMPMLWNPNIWQQYFEATAAQSAGTHNTPSDWMHPTLGYWLRTLHPERPMWVMFLPLLAAVPVVAGYWWVRRKAWSWPTELPRLVLASLLTAPYGAWGFDLVLLLVPVIQAAVWVANDPRKWVRVAFLGAFAAINLLALFSLRFENSMANGWLTPVVAVGFVAAGFVTSRKRERREEAVAPHAPIPSLTLPARQNAEALPS